MIKSNKFNLKFGLLLSILLLISAIAVPGFQQIPNMKLMRLHNSEQIPLGDDDEITEVIEVDIKVQKIKNFNEEDNNWYKKIEVFIGNILRFNISVKNLVNYDLVNVKIVNILSSYDIEYIINSGIVNDIPEEPNIKGKNLTWYVSELKAQ